MRLRRNPDNAIRLQIKVWDDKDPSTGQDRRFAGIIEEAGGPREGFRPQSFFNPGTGQYVTKFIDHIDNGIIAQPIKLEEYDTGDKYAHRYVGHSLHLYSADANETYVLDFPYGKRHMRDFARRCPNIDWSKPIWVNAFWGRPDDKAPKGHLAFYIRQQNAKGEWVAVRAAFTQEDPGDCPPPVQNRRTRAWDWQEHYCYLSDMLTEQIAPAIEAAHAAKEVAAPKAAPVAAEPETVSTEWNETYPEDIYEALTPTRKTAQSRPEPAPRSSRYRGQVADDIGI